MNAEGRKIHEKDLRRKAWVDRKEKLISFHPIDSGQLLRAPEPIFWERILSLANTGYRVQ